MSLPEVRGAGRLITDPKTGPTRSGGTWTNGLVRFQAWKRDGETWTEGDSVVASIIGFDDVAAALAAYTKGDELAVQGTVSVGMWKDQPQLKVTLSKVWTPERQPRGDHAARGQQGNTSSAADSVRSQPGEPAAPKQQQRGARQQPATDAPRRESAVVTNLRDHAARRRRAGPTTQRPA
ncbi:single-stranded DNA-binding protein [Dactylosporangium sp. NPDC051484]|uniref:single-stranded DNA-binding protein n=1 Tax=Dactylosporangium sp. NPDC051484 TaxID=3154942 RepID=UPI00344D50BD